MIQRNQSPHFEVFHQLGMLWMRANPSILTLPREQVVPCIQKAFARAGVELYIDAHLKVLRARCVQTKTDWAIAYMAKSDLTLIAQLPRLLLKKGKKGMVKALNLHQVRVNRDCGVGMVFNANMHTAPNIPHLEGQSDVQCLNRAICESIQILVTPSWDFHFRIDPVQYAVLLSFLQHTVPDFELLANTLYAHILQILQPPIQKFAWLNGLWQKWVFGYATVSTSVGMYSSKYFLCEIYHRPDGKTEAADLREELLYLLKFIFPLPVNL